VTYNVDDLVSIRSEAGEVSFALPLGRVLPYLGVAAGLASWLRFVHH
jgi:hypothetical protein